MRWLTVRLLLVLTVGCLMGESRARGEFVDFSYAWSIKPAPVIPSGTGSVTFSLESGSSTAEVGGTQALVIPGATITTDSVAVVPPGSPDKYDTNFEMTLTLKEGSSAQREMTFKGSLTGNLTADSSSLTIKFDTPTSQSVTINGHDYNVGIGPLQISLPAPGSEFTAKIDAQVEVASTASSTPEPSALVLGATALVGFDVRGWARRRRETC